MYTVTAVLHSGASKRKGVSMGAVAIKGAYRTFKMLSSVIESSREPTSFDQSAFKLSRLPDEIRSNPELTADEKDLLLMMHEEAATTAEIAYGLKLRGQKK